MECLISTYKFTCIKRAVEAHSEIITEPLLNTASILFYNYYLVLSFCDYINTVCYQE